MEGGHPPADCCSAEGETREGLVEDSEQRNTVSWPSRNAASPELLAFAGL